MSDGVTIRVEGSEETARALEKRQAGLTKAAVLSLRQSAEIVYGRAAENVSGRILHVRTGTLRRRLSTQIFADSLQAKVGSPVVYAPIQEYGGTIQHPGGTAYYYNERQDRTIFLSNKAAAGHAFPRTRPHSITIPARPWLRPALADSRGDIEAIFTKNAEAALASPEAAAP